MSTAMKNSEIKLLPDGRMDAKHAAVYVGLSDRTLATMRSQGAGPVYYKRGRIFYFKEDLDKWIEAGKQLPTEREIF